MDIRGKMKTGRLAVILLLPVSCAYTQRAVEKENETVAIEKDIPAAGDPQDSMPFEISTPPLPELLPVKEETSPLKTKTISITARNTPLRDVLYTIAETANLNLVIERGVDPELPVTMTCVNLTVEDALDLLSDSVDYFYHVKNNILIFSAMGTEIIEFGRPNVTQDYKSDVGGDIIGGISSSGGESGSITGKVSMKATSDKTSFQFWAGMEKTLTTLLHKEGEKREGALQPRFVINRMTGAIMVTATKKDLEKIVDYISTLKKVLNRQVLIEARIVEVQLSEGLQYGIDWTAVGEWLGVGATTFGTRLFAEATGTAEPYFEFGITENDNLSLVLKALQRQGDVKTLSNPRINIMNGQTSLLSVGRNTTFIAKVETTTTVSDGSAPTTTFTVETNSILSGIIFGLVPYINNYGEITMTITPIVTNLVALEAKIIGSGDNSVEIKLPTVDLREMSTTVKVMEGQMVVIGGLIDKKQKSREENVPFLSDIPFIGKAFRRVDKTDENTELVIMLIPRIIR